MTTRTQPRTTSTRGQVCHETRLLVCTMGVDRNSSDSTPRTDSRRGLEHGLRSRADSGSTRWAEAVCAVQRGSFISAGMHGSI